MSSAIRTSQMPYGAFELKATYQRNMMLGNLIVILMAITILTTTWALGEPPREAAEKKISEDRHALPSPRSRQIRIITDQPQIGISSPRNIRSDAGILTPVPGSRATVLFL